MIGVIIFVIVLLLGATLLTPGTREMISPWISVPVIMVASCAWVVINIKN